jgi:hypothetical protein
MACGQQQKKLGSEQHSTSQAFSGMEECRGDGMDLDGKTVSVISMSKISTIILHGQL